MEESNRRTLKPLRRLIPYVLRYRGVAIGAAVSLVVAALTTLTLPLAVRRMIDHGFSSSDSTFIATGNPTCAATRAASSADPATALRRTGSR